MTTTDRAWRVKRLNQGGKTYVQACIQRDNGLFTAGIGYAPPYGDVDDDLIRRVLDALNEPGVTRLLLDDPLVAVGDDDDEGRPPPGGHRTPLPDTPAVRRQRVKDFALRAARSGRTIAQIFGPEKPDYRRMTLRDFLRTVYVPYRQPQVTEKTWESEGPRFDLLARSPFAETRLADLSAAGWHAYIHSFTNWAPRSKKILENLYRGALKYAEFLGAVEDLHPFLKIKGSSKRTWEVTPLTVDEVGKLLEHAPTLMHRALFATGIGAALRPGELMGLRWEDVSWEKKSIRVRGTKTTASDATIPMIAFVERELVTWWERQGHPTRGFAFTRGGLQIASYKKAIATAGSKAGIDGDGRRIHPYVLRHTFATLAACSTPPVPLPVAMAVMRHTNSKMLLEVYAKAGALMVTAGLENFPLR